TLGPCRLGHSAEMVCSLARTPELMPAEDLVYVRGSCESPAHHDSKAVPKTVPFENATGGVSNEGRAHAWFGREAGGPAQGQGDRALVSQLRDRGRRLDKRRRAIARSGLSRMALAICSKTSARYFGQIMSRRGMQLRFFFLEGQGTRRGSRDRRGFGGTTSSHRAGAI